MKSDVTKAKKNYHHGDLRQAVVKAAVHIIGERGDVSFTIRELAQLTEVSHPAVYRHFTNKRAVLAAVAEEGFQLLRAELKKAELSHASDPVGVLKSQGENYLNFVLDHVGHFRAMYHAELSDKSDFPLLAAAYQDSSDLLVKNFKRGLAAGIFREARAEALALAFWSMVHGFLDLTLQGQLLIDLRKGRKAIQRNAADMIDLLLKGFLKAR